MSPKRFFLPSIFFASSAVTVPTLIYATYKFGSNTLSKNNDFYEDDTFEEKYEFTNIWKILALKRAELIENKKLVKKLIVKNDQNKNRAIISILKRKIRFLENEIKNLYLQSKPKYRKKILIKLAKNTKNDLVDDSFSQYKPVEIYDENSYE